MIRKYIYHISLLLLLIFVTSYTADNTTVTIQKMNDQLSLYINRGKIELDIFFPDRFVKKTSVEQYDTSISKLPQVIQDSITLLNQDLNTLRSNMVTLSKPKDLPDKSSTDYDEVKLQNQIYEKSKQLFNTLPAQVNFHKWKSIQLGDETIGDITVAYSPGTTVQAIKRYIYEDLEKQNKHFFNITIMENHVPMKDNDRFPDEQNILKGQRTKRSVLVPSKNESTALVEIGLRLDASLLTFIDHSKLSMTPPNKPETNKIGYSISHAPSLSIDNQSKDSVSLIIKKLDNDNFSIWSAETKTEIQYGPRQDNFLDFDAQFKAALNIDATMIRPRDMQSNDIQIIESTRHLYNLFKNALYLWAQAQEPKKNITLEAKKLEYIDSNHLRMHINALKELAHKPSSPSSKPSVQKPSSSFLQQLKNWFSTRLPSAKTLAAATIGAFGVFTFGAFAHKNTNWFSNWSWFKPSPPTSRMTPNLAK